MSLHTDDYLDGNAAAGERRRGRLGSGAFEAIEWKAPPPRWTQRIGEPSGYKPVETIGSSNVVPTKTSFSSGETTTIVVTRLGLSWVFAVYRSGRGVSLPSVSTDMSRRWSGPNECSTNSMPFEGAQASDLAVPLAIHYPTREPAVFLYAEAGD